MAEVWQSCYDLSWKEMIVEGAFAHPAKMARGLVGKIYDYLFEHGFLKKGDVVVDPFGGICTTGIIGACRGVRVFACELEPKFVALAKQNIDLHRRTWEAFGDPIPVIVQGDSRKLREVLGPVLAAAVLSSPPYAESNVTEARRFKSHKDAGGGDAKVVDQGYGETPGQLAAMEGGQVDAVLSSPPYAECLRGDNSAKETAAESLAKRKTPGGSTGQSCRHAGYGSKENLGDLPAGVVDGVVSSPPWEKGAEGGLRGSKFGDREKFAEKMLEQDAAQPATHRRSKKAALAQMERDANRTYGDSEGQLGQEQGQTFWHAARDIVLECHAILKPGGVAVWVTKDFARNKARVTFSADWLKLCDACGFELVEWIHASLVKQRAVQTLFNGTEQVSTERKSFFRRLYEKKPGAVRIDWEDVIVVRKR